MKLFITGSESFIGKELINYCKNNSIEYIGIDSEESDDKFNIKMDIRSEKITDVIPNDCDAIVHLAAVSTVKDAKKDQKTAYDVNIIGTINLLRSCQLKGVKQFIFASSDWVYDGEADSDKLLLEDCSIDINKVTKVYPLTKLVGERVLHIAHIDEQINATVLRFGMAYGASKKFPGPVEGIIKEMRNQEYVDMYGSIDTARRFTHVSDIVKGIVLSIGLEGFNVINLCGDNLISLRDIVNVGKKLLDKNVKIVQKNNSPKTVRNPDNKKAKRVLNLDKSTSIEEGIKSLLD